MSLYMVAAKRPQDERPTTWIFEDLAYAIGAKHLAMGASVLVADNFNNPEMISDFHEFQSWLQGDA